MMAVLIGTGTFRAQLLVCQRGRSAHDTSRHRLTGRVTCIGNAKWYVHELSFRCIGCVMTTGFPVPAKNVFSFVSTQFLTVNTVF